MSGEVLATIGTMVKEYEALKTDIEEMQLKQSILRDRIQEAMPPYSLEENPPVVTAYGTVAWTKGRHTEKVDVKTVKQRLVLNGVPIGTIDEAFAAGTETTDGRPSLRITAKR